MGEPIIKECQGYTKEEAFEIIKKATEYKNAGFYYEFFSAQRGIKTRPQGIQGHHPSRIARTRVL